MEPFLVPIEQFQNFLLCLARVIALIAAIPAFAGSGISAQSKIILAFTTALLLFPAMALNAKRWHDRGRSGWWSLVLLVPLLGALYTLYELGVLPAADAEVMARGKAQGEVQLALRSYADIGGPPGRGGTARQLLHLADDRIIQLHQNLMSTFFRSKILFTCT